MNEEALTTFHMLPMVHFIYIYINRCAGWLGCALSKHSIEMKLTHSMFLAT